MSKTISVRIAHLNSRKSHGQKRHDLREKVPGYIDEKKTKKNTVIIQAPDIGNLKKEIGKHIKIKTGKKMRSDSNLTTSGIITFGEEAQKQIQQMGKDGQDSFFETVATELAANFFDRKLIGLVVHRDEKSVHAHFILRYWKHDLYTGKEIPLKLNRSDMSRLQDMAGSLAEQWGLDIHRGIPKKQRLAQGDDPKKIYHLNVHQLHEEILKDLKKYKILKSQLANLKKKISVEEQKQMSLGRAKTHFEKNLQSKITRKTSQKVQSRDFENRSFGQDHF